MTQSCKQREFEGALPATKQNSYAQGQSGIV